MLMKFAKVLDDGEFIKPKSQVLTYGTMTLVRVTIVRDQALFLSKAATIAMRYATVRRQSPIDPNQPEPKIIDHVTQQMKIFPAIRFRKRRFVKASRDACTFLLSQINFNGRSRSGGSNL
jgi:acyl-CoA oxidase